MKGNAACNLQRSGVMSETRSRVVNGYAKRQKELSLPFFRAHRMKTKDKANKRLRMNT